MQTLLVTGGLGFIGSHTCVELVKRGYQIYIIDSLINSYVSNLGRIKKTIEKENKNNTVLKFFQGDICDVNFLNSVFEIAKKNGNIIQGVIHFAGLKSVNQSIKYPLKYWNSNFIGAINLVKVLQKHNINNLIFSSSAAVYSPKNKSPITEKDNLEPLSPYGKTKYCIEQVLFDLFNSHPESWKIINLRYFNPIGAHPSGLIGEIPIGIPNNIFPLINKVASKEIKTLKIFGNDWDTPDGTAVRDYIHIMDLVEGHIMAYEYMVNNSPQFLNVNLGTGKGTSVLELVNTFKKVNNKDVPFIFSKRREGDVAEIFADNSLAKELFNWVPKRNIVDMCLDGWNWQKNFF